MKANRLSGLLLFLILIATAFRLSAQPGEADRKRFEDTKAKAEKGDAFAQWSLGNAYLKGEGVAKDDVEAAKWYRKAAEQNDAVGQYNLGVCYHEGRGGSQR
jgi:TPR repeat protein